MVGLFDCWHLILWILSYDWITTSNAYEVGLSMIVQTLLSIDMKAEEMIMSGYNTLSWMDNRLTWNTSEYDDLGEIRIQSDKIWTPGIIFYNARDGQFNQKYKVRLSVYPNGLVSWMPPALFRATCNIKVRLFPFDKQD